MKKHLRAVSLYLTAILCLPLTLHANTYAGHLNQHVSTTPELTRSHISNIQQDSNGFMWMATWNGLIRYDGYTTHTFKPIQNSCNTIDSDRIYNIKMAAGGNIWCVSSDNRLFLFNPQSFTFQNLSSSIAELHGKNVKVLTPLKNDHTWVRFHDGGCVRLSDINPTDSIVYYHRPSDIINGAHTINSISLDDNNNEWLLTDKGALNVTQNKVIPNAYKYVESLHGATFLISDTGLITGADDNRTVHSGFIDGNKVRYVRTDGHRIILATDGGIMSVDIRNGHTIRHTSKASSYIYKDSHHRVWGFGPDNGVIMIPDLSTDVSITLMPSTGCAHAPIKNPQLIFETSDGEIILRPGGGALCRYDEKSQQLSDIPFDDIPDGYYNPLELKKYTVDDHGNLWVLHNDGTDCISFSRRTFSHKSNYPASEVRAIATDSRGHQWSGLRPNRIITDGFSMTTSAPAYVIKESPDKKIYIGTKGDGMYVVDPANKFAITHLSRKATDGLRIHSDSIYDIAFEGDKIWLGSYGNGLACGKVTSDGWHFEKTPDQPHDMKIRNILPDGNGNLLIATADGLITTDAGHNPRPKFYINKFRHTDDGLKGNDIMRVLECDGSYYACVFGSGISRIDSECLLTDSLTFTTYILPSSSEAGQMRTAISSGHDIWLTAGGTITRFTPRNHSMSSILCDTPADRISFSEAAPAFDSDGNILFGTTGGILTFSPDDLPASDQSYDLKATGILYQNDMSVHPLNAPTQLVLTPDKRSFTLLLSDMSYTLTPGQHVRYQLDGLEDGWNYPHGSFPALTYNNLPPGNYMLVIQVESPDGEWRDSSECMNIQVIPTFIETIWFRLTIMLILIALFTGLTLAIIHYKHLRNALQRKYSLLMTIGHISNRLDDEAAIRTQPAPTPKEDDRLFIETSFKFLNDNIDNPDLMVDDFARHLKMSRTAYYNRMKEVAGVSPVDFIRQTRIKRALKHLESDKYTISEVAYMVGFSDPKYFSRCFKAEMAMTPSQYRESSSHTETN